MTTKFQTNLSRRSLWRRRITYTSAQKESIMQNKPNFPQFCAKNSYLEEKQTHSNPIFRVFFLTHFAHSPQSNPICSELACTACPELVKGNIIEVSNLFKTTPAFCELFLFLTFPYPGYNLAMQKWTIQKLLNWITEYLTKKRIDSPRLSAEILLSGVLSMQRIDLYTQFDKQVSQEHLQRLHDLVKRAAQNEPVAYLLGKTEFYSLQFNITPDCMVPRPETELLTERAIEFLRTRPEKQLICDLCTGSGCIAIAIAVNCPHARLIATDICDAALSVAAKNLEKYHLKERIKLLCGDLFDPLVPHLDVEKFDLIVCNPPYVSAAEFENLAQNITDYEPKLALFAGVDGLDTYRRICEKADAFLKPDAALMMEIGYSQGHPVRQLLEQTGCFDEIKIEKDAQNNDRIITAKKHKH